MKERKTAQIITRVTEADRDWVRAEAEKMGIDPSSFIRMILRRARDERGLPDMFENPSRERLNQMRPLIYPLLKAQLRK